MGVGPSEPSCRRRFKTSSHCCGQKAVAVSREGKVPARLGQVTSGKKNESESPFLMSKRMQTISNVLVSTS
jgi:hypothetical protein